MKKIVLTNDYHNAEVRLMPKDNKLSIRQIKRAKRVLCGVDGCTCSNEFGTRGRQDGFSLELVRKRRTNEIRYALVHKAPKIQRNTMENARLDFFSLELKYDK
jgi:hypothetical protein